MNSTNNLNELWKLVLPRLSLQVRTPPAGHLNCRLVTKSSEPSCVLTPEPQKLWGNKCVVLSRLFFFFAARQLPTCFYRLYATSFWSSTSCFTGVLGTWNVTEVKELKCHKMASFTITDIPLDLDYNLNKSRIKSQSWKKTSKLGIRDSYAMFS